MPVYLQCKTPGCTKRRRLMNDGGGYYDYCSLRCRDQGQQLPPAGIQNVICYSIVAVCTQYHTVGNFCERKLSRISENKIFSEKIFADCSLVLLKDATLPNFAKKTFLNSHITGTLKFTQVFSLESYPLYSTPCYLCYNLHG